MSEEQEREEQALKFKIRFNREPTEKELEEYMEEE